MSTKTTTRKSTSARFGNRYSWGAMAFLWLLLALNDNARYWITGVLQPAIVKEFNIDAATMGWFAGGLTLAQGLLAIPIGAWSDKGGHGWSRKYRYVWIAIGYTIFTLLTGFTALTSTLLMLFILQAMNKAISGGGEAVEVASVTEWWPLEKRGFATGLHHTAVPWGMFLGSLLVAAYFTIFNAEHWRGALLIPVILIVPVLILWWRFSTKQRYERFEATVMAGGETPPLQKLDNDLVRPPAGAFKRALKNPNLVIVSIIAGFACAVYVGISAWIPLYLSFIENYSLAQTAALSLIFTITGGIGQIFWGGISDKIGRKPALIIIMLWIATGLVLFQFVGIHILMLIFVQLFLGCAINGVFAVLYAMSSDSTEPGALGLGLGMNMTGQLLGGVGPLMVGLLISAGGGYTSKDGFVWGLYAMAGLMIISVLLLALFTRETVGRNKHRDRALVSPESCIPDPVMRAKDLQNLPEDDR